MRKFVQRHQEQILGVLSGFDRMRFRGTLRLLQSEGGVATWLEQVGVAVKDFLSFAEGLLLGRRSLRADSGAVVELVSIERECRAQRSRVAGPADGWKRHRLCATGQRFPPDQRLRTCPETGEPTAKDQVDGAIGPAVATGASAPRRVL